jgi:hypothetical protein
MAKFPLSLLPQQTLDLKGRVNAGGTLTLYYRGTPTLLPVYSDMAGTKADNPFVIPDSGKVDLFVDAGVYFDMALKDVHGAPIWSVYNRIVNDTDPVPTPTPVEPIVFDQITIVGEGTEEDPMHTGEPVALVENFYDKTQSDERYYQKLGAREQALVFAKEDGSLARKTSADIAYLRKGNYSSLAKGATTLNILVANADLTGASYNSFIPGQIYSFISETNDNVVKFKNMNGDIQTATAYSGNSRAGCGSVHLICISGGGTFTGLGLKTDTTESEPIFEMLRA